jgi:hypothetical protein
MQLSELMVCADLCGWADRGALQFVGSQLCRAARNEACLSHHCRHWERVGHQDILTDRPSVVMWLWLVATVDTHDPPPHCALIHCLVSVNFQQASMNINGWKFFPLGRIQWHLLLRTNFRVRHHFARVLLCCYLQNLQTTGGKVKPLLSYHQHPPLTSWANIIKWDALLWDRYFLQIFICNVTKYSKDRALCVATGCGLGDRVVGVWVLVGLRIIISLCLPGWL